MKQDDLTPHITQYVIASSVLGRDMRLLVWRPTTDAPKGGFPVLYSFDGETSISLFADLAKRLQTLGKRYHISAPVIVGMAEMPGNNSIDQRIYDLSPSDDPSTLPKRPNHLPWPKIGGGNAYLEMIEKDFKPFINAHYSINQHRQMLFGHSLGGLMTLHALATHPENFSSYYASSPSLWFDTPKRFEEISNLLADKSFMPDHPIALGLSVGQDEAKIEKWAEMSLTKEQRELRLKWKHNNDMLDHIRDLAKLVENKAGSKIDLHFTVFPGEDHHTAEAIAMSRALKIIMTPPQDILPK